MLGLTPIILRMLIDIRQGRVAKALNRTHHSHAKTDLLAELEYIERVYGQCEQRLHGEWRTANELKRVFTAALEVDYPVRANRDTMKGIQGVVHR